MSGRGPGVQLDVLVDGRKSRFGLVALGLLKAGQFVRIARGLLDSGNAEARALGSARRPRSIQPHCGR